jgi:hypothetical protein
VCSGKLLNVRLAGIPSSLWAPPSVGNGVLMNWSLR